MTSRSRDASVSRALDWIEDNDPIGQLVTRVRVRYIHMRHHINRQRIRTVIAWVVDVGQSIQHAVRMLLLVRDGSQSVYGVRENRILSITFLDSGASNI